MRPPIDTGVVKRAVAGASEFVLERRKGKLRLSTS